MLFTNYIIYYCLKHKYFGIQNTNMIVTDARKRLKAQMLRDQQVVVKEHQAAKELHKHLCDISKYLNIKIHW